MPSSPREPNSPVAAGRLTNLALFLLLAMAFLSGWLAFELSGGPARGVLYLHAAAGVAIVLLVPWKSLVARRGLRRRRGVAVGSLPPGVGGGGLVCVGGGDSPAPP